MSSTPSTAERLPSARGIWYALLVFGLLTLGVGVFFIVDPDETLKVFTVIIGIFLLVDGVLAMLAGVVGRGEGRGLLALVGVLSVVAGLVLIKKPFAALNLFIIILGIWFVVAGIARFVYAFTLEEGRAGYIVTALIDAVAGILILSWPELGLSTLGVIIGIVLVFRGALFTYGAWRLLRAERSDGGPGTPAYA
jgi:uncharacterized membrane protein HdeD (DUF308 family)